LLRYNQLRVEANISGAIVDPILSKENKKFRKYPNILLSITNAPNKGLFCAYATIKVLINDDLITYGADIHRRTLLGAADFSVSLMYFTTCCIDIHACYIQCVTYLIVGLMYFTTCCVDIHRLPHIMRD